MEYSGQPLNLTISTEVAARKESARLRCRRAVLNKGALDARPTIYSAEIRSN